MGEDRQGVNRRSVQVDEARMRTGRKVWVGVMETMRPERKVWVGVMERGIPTLRVAWNTPQEGTRATRVFPPALPPHCWPRPGKHHGPCPGCRTGDAPREVRGIEQAPGTALSFGGQGCVRACVRVRVREAPSRHGPGSPAGSLRSPMARPLPPHLGSPRLPGRTHTPGKLIGAWLQMKFY